MEELKVPRTAKKSRIFLGESLKGAWKEGDTNPFGKGTVCYPL